MPERLSAKLEQLVRTEQREKRLASLAAAVLRDGEVIWETAVGAANVESAVEATPDTQYRVGSITKTFTAAAIMQLRDEGKLDLEDSLEQHLEGAAYSPTIRRLLSHASGLQRETHDDSWLTFRFAPPDELLETPRPGRDGASVRRPLPLLEPRLRAARDRRRERLRPAVHGVPPRAPVRAGRADADQLRARASGRDRLCVAAVRRRCLGGRRRRDGRVGVRGPAVGDGRRPVPLGAFLADPDESVLAKKSAEEMRTVQAIADHERWLAGYGLGLGLVRDGERILAGHGGSMPGFIAGLYFSAEEKVSIAVLTNDSGALLGDLELGLVRTTIDEWSAAPEPWSVGDPPPDDVVPLLGLWFVEAAQVVFRWREGKLEARFDRVADWQPSSVFERQTADRWRTVSGPEQGEALRIERAEDGSVKRMIFWAGYPVTREPGAWH